MDINYLKNSIYDGMNFNKGKGSSIIIKATDGGFTYKYFKYQIFF
ncbi:hypothetical protein [Crassaminicella profunda]|nr:hypothetical protein [Crassaminicella profunda]